MFLGFAFMWSLVVMGVALWIWKKFNSHLKVHLIIWISCIYFVGIFEGYGFFNR